MLVSVCLSVGVWKGRTYRLFGGGNGEWKNIIFPPSTLPYPFPPPPSPPYTMPSPLPSPPYTLPSNYPPPFPTNFSSTLIQTFYPMVRTFPGLRVLPERFYCKVKSKTFSIKKDLYIIFITRDGLAPFSIRSFIVRERTITLVFLLSKNFD